MAAEKPSLQMGWLLKMAWRDSRRSRGRLLLFISSIVLGVAALVAIQSFGDNLRQDIEDQAQKLLGADMVLSSRRAPTEEVMHLVDSLKFEGEMARETSFPSMVTFKKSEMSRLVNAKALEGNFPFYGEFNTMPANMGRSLQNGERKALVDQTLMLQFDAEVGDSIKLGEIYFEIAASLIQVPGSNNMGSTVAPSVYFPYQHLDATGLVNVGSRVNYAFFYDYPEGFDFEAMDDSLRSRMRRQSLRMETVAERKESVGEAFSQMTQFLNLVGFVALLLGCVGVASAVHIYMKEKISSVAVLRCLGVQGKQAFLIYLIQISVLGFIGAIVGAALGSIIQGILPNVLADFLPFEASVAVSWPAILMGVITGVAITILFALQSLLPIRKVSPLLTLRASYEAPEAKRDTYLILVRLGIALFIMAFAWWQMGSLMEAFVFTLALGLAFLALTGVARLVMWAVRKYFPSNWNFLWRQSLANLYRPNNQTLVLLISIGLGTTLITTLFFVQNLLLGQVEFTGRDSQPNMVLFDIRTEQKEEIAELATSYDLPLLQQVPIVTMRMAELHGKTRAEMMRDTARRRSRRWAMNRTYRATYRDHLLDSEELVDGEWHGTKAEDGTIYVSLEDDFGRDDLGLKIGDKLKFDIQGVLMEVTVGSFRKIDFARFQTNFIVLFPADVLEAAPQQHVLITRVPSREVSASFQREAIKKFANVSMIDLDLVLKTVDEVISKVSFVIRFMALFSIITGFLVLIGSVILSRFQRVKESVLLRTIGASRRQILVINALEYAMLGGLACITGIGLSFLATWALAYFSFEIAFVPEFWPPFFVFFSITLLTVVIGLMNSRGIVSKPPLEVLRREVG